MKQRRRKGPTVNPVPRGLLTKEEALDLIECLKEDALQLIPTAHRTINREYRALVKFIEFHTTPRN